VTSKGRHEALESEVVGRLRDSRRRCIGGQDKARRCVESFQNEPAAKNLVSLAVRDATVPYQAFPHLFMWLSAKKGSTEK
jgi:hypothetical protein